MTLPEFIAWVRQGYESCVTTSARENKCALRLANLPKPLVMIDGSKYQSMQGTAGKLADRIIFSESHGGFVCVAELKSGSWKARDTIRQIKNGFDIAQEMLDFHSVRISLSIPLVLSPEGFDSRYERLLQTNPLGLTESRRRLMHSRCGTELSEVLRLI